MAKGEATFNIKPQVDDASLKQAQTKLKFDDVKVKVGLDVESTRQELNKLKTEYAANMQIIRDTNKALKDGATLTKEQETAYNNAKKAAEEKKKAIGDTLKSLKEASKETSTMSESVTKAAGGFGDITNKLAKIGLAMQGIQQITGLFNQFTEPYKEFDKQLKNIGTLGVQNFEDFRNAAIDLASGVPDTVAGVTEAVYNAISAGAIEVVEGQADIANGMNFITQASKLAVAGLTDTNSAVKGLASITNAYGTELISAGEAADILFATVKNGVTTIPELNASLSNVVPIAAASGIAFEEIGAAIATLTKQGVPTAQATTQIRSAMVELLKPGKELANVMNLAGVSVDTLKAEGLQVTMQKIGKAMQEAGTDAANTFGRIEAIQFALATTGDNSDKFKADLDAIKAGAGSVEEAFAIANEGIGVRVQGILNQIEAVAFKAFGAIGDGAVVAIDAINKIAPTATGLVAVGQLLPVDAFKNFASFITTTAVPALVTHSKALFATATAKETYSVANLKAIAMTTKNIVATKAATAAQWLYNMALKANPIGIIVTAVAGLAAIFVTLYKNSEDFRNVIDGVFDGLKEFADSLLQVASSIWQFLKPIGEFIGGTLIVVFKVLFEIMKAITVAIATGFIQQLKILYSLLSSLVSNVMNGLVTTFTTLYNAFASITGSMSAMVSSGSAMNAVFKALSPAISALINPVISLYQYFKRAGDVGTYVKGMMAGLSNTFVTFSNVLSKAWSSLTSLDVKGFGTALASLPKQLKEGFDKGFNAAVDDEKAKKRAKEISADVVKEVKKGNAELVLDADTTNKKIAQSTKQASIDILAEYESRKKSLQTAFEIGEIEKDNERTRLGLSKTAKDDLASQQAKVSILQEQKKQLEEIAKAYSGTISEGNIIGLKLDENNAKKLKEEYSKVNTELQKSILAEEGIQLKVDIQYEQVKKELDKIRREAQKENLQFEFRTNIITEIEFNTSMRDILREEVNLSIQELDKLEQQKIEFAYDPQKTLQIEKDINRVVTEIRQRQIEIDNLTVSINDDSARQALSQISDNLERERKLRLFELARTYDQQLIQARGNKDAELNVIREFAKKEADIQAEYAEKAMSAKQRTFLSSMSIISSAFSNISIPDNSDGKRRAEEQLKALDEQRSALDRAYRNGEKSYADYVNAMNELDEQRVKAQKEASKQSIEIGKATAEALAKSFEGVANETRLQISSNIAKYQDANAEIQVIKAKMLDVESDTAEWALLNETLASSTATATSAMNEAWIGLGTNVGAVFAQMLAEGNSFLKATVVAALAGLKGIIPILIAQIYAKEIASKSFAGIATATALTAVLTALVSVAEASVRTMKFASGGEVPTGERLITVNERGQEFVVNHIAYSKNKEALKEINKRNISIEQYARERQLGNVEKSMSVDANGFLLIEKRLAKLEDTVSNALVDVKNAVHSSRYRTESVVDLQFNDKELVERYEITRKNNIRKF